MSKDQISHCMKLMGSVLMVLYVLDANSSRSLTRLYQESIADGAIRIWWDQFSSCHGRDTSRIMWIIYGCKLIRCLYVRRGLSLNQAVCSQGIKRALKATHSPFPLNFSSNVYLLDLGGHWTFKAVINF